MRLRIDHNTDYVFASPVRLGRHRLMLRPRDSFDLRILHTGLTITPTPTLTWTHDVYGNSICWADFPDEPVPALSIQSSLTIERFESKDPTPAAMAWTPGAPIAYDADESASLAPYMTPAVGEDDGSVTAFALKAVTAPPPVEGETAIATPHPLTALANAIHQALTYRMRFEEGTQAPAHTLATGSGTCRDYAWLFIECARRLGYAARFVTGYLHAAPDGRGQATSGHSHAWADVYVPGDGWVEFDPTNLLVGDRQLIRVAVTRTPAEAIPISGTFNGQPQQAAPQVAVTIRPLEALAA